MTTLSSLNLYDNSEVPDGKEIITTLLKLMEDNRGRLIVIAAGYPLEMHKFLESNPGLKSRFTNIIDFPNYNTDELVSIFSNMCFQGGYSATSEAIKKVYTHVAQLNTNTQINTFGNARGIRNIYEKSILAQANRVVLQRITDRVQLQTLIADDVLVPQRRVQAISPQELETLLAPLNALVGLETVKQEVTDLVHFLHIKVAREERGLLSSPVSLHSIFSGPPGTGKTSVARLLGKILCRLGFLEKGHVVEVDRSKLVGRWTGHTPQIVTEVFKEAEGGILFIDEAYSLVETTEGANYGYEAITTLLKLMEDYRDKVLVVCAGYDDEMNKFLDKNPGLKSRFPQQLHFKPYTPREMTTVFENLCNAEQYMPTQEALARIHAYLVDLDKNSLNRLGNARLVRNIFEKTIRNQSRRISQAVQTNLDLLSITADDIGLPQEPNLHKVGFI